MCILHDIETQNNQLSIYLLSNNSPWKWCLVSFLKNENHFTFKEKKEIDDDDDKLLM
jgi:hypothetical protein